MRRNLQQKNERIGKVPIDSSGVYSLLLIENEKYSSSLTLNIFLEKIECKIYIRDDVTSS